MKKCSSQVGAVPVGLFKYLSSGPACTLRCFVSGRMEAVIRNKHAQGPHPPPSVNLSAVAGNQAQATFSRPLPWSSRRDDIGLVLIFRHPGKPFLRRTRALSSRHLTRRGKFLSWAGDTGVDWGTESWVRKLLTPKFKFLLGFQSFDFENEHIPMPNKGKFCNAFKYIFQSKLRGQ